MGLLNWPFNSSDVHNEFGDGTPHIMSNMYNAIFGGWGAGAFLSDFDNTGMVQNLQRTSVDPDTFSATLFGEVDPQNVTTYVYAELTDSGSYGDDSTPLPPNSSDADSFTTGTVQVTGTTNQAFQIDASNLSENTSYTYRLIAYNAYNDDDETFYITTSSGTFTTDEDRLAIPTIDGTKTFSTQMYVSFNYSDNEDDFSFEVRINSGAGENAAVDCQNNFGTSNDSKEAVLQFGSTFPSSTDTVEVRVKAEENSTGTADSFWSGWQNLSYDSGTPSCPI